LYVNSDLLQLDKSEFTWLNRYESRRRPVWEGSGVKHRFWIVLMLVLALTLTAFAEDALHRGRG
jgi:hypothetical protein